RPNSGARRPGAAAATPLLGQRDVHLSERRVDVDGGPSGRVVEARPAGEEAFMILVQLTGVGVHFADAHGCVQLTDSRTGHGQVNLTSSEVDVHIAEVAVECDVAVLRADVE